MGSLPHGSRAGNTVGVFGCPCHVKKKMLSWLEWVCTEALQWLVMLPRCFLVALRSPLCCFTNAAIKAEFKINEEEERERDENGTKRTHVSVVFQGNNESEVGCGARDVHVM